MQSVYTIRRQYLDAFQQGVVTITQLLLALLLVSCPQLIAAQNLPTGTQTVNGDYIIPNGINTITITATGGSGGDANTPTSCNYRGGRGAVIRGTFYVSSATCSAGFFVMKPGGRLRFIRGLNGRDGSEGGQDRPIGCGGGGSAALYQAPGSSTWNIVLVAGGGGGAYANRTASGTACLGGNGFDASLTESGTNGGGTYPGAGGNGGAGGSAGGLIPGDGGGGGGAFGAGAGGIYATGGQVGFPSGGAGGLVEVGTSTSNGGFGFGGGAARRIAGGGGGGYSGGGGGSEIGSGAGGGGGSYISSSAVNVLKSVATSTSSSGGSIQTITTSGADQLPALRIYVNQAASGANNGSSWANAFTSLQDALTAAATVCSAEIWVARGVYYPDEGVGFTNNNRSHAFNIKSGMALYGGFAGNETTLAQRNWIANPTYLSGDLQKNENNTISATFPNTGDNAYHVVTSINVNATAVLDGFSIFGGNANGSGSDNSGGGIYSVNSNMLISRCNVFYNQAVQGGGLYNNQSSPVIIGCLFKSNKVVLGAAGVYVLNFSSPYFYNCVFQSNYVGTTTVNGGGGGAILNAESSTPEFINCTVSGNFARSGGAVYNLQNSRPIFFNSVIAQNLSDNAAKRIESDASSGVQFRNCFVQDVDLSASNGNLDGTVNAALFEFPDNPALAPESGGILNLAQCSYLINKGNNGYLGIEQDIVGNNRFVGASVDVGAYEAQSIVQNIYYQDLDRDGYGNPNVSQLACEAPRGYETNNLDCNDNSDYVFPGAVEFCDGLDNDCNGSVDDVFKFYRDADGDGQGNPYIVQGACTNVAPPGFVGNGTDCNDGDASNTLNRLYVNKLATGLNDGSSWVNAFTSLQDALSHHCSQINEIWVARGTYFPDEGRGRFANSTGESFEMRNNLAIYGGFAGNETLLSQRNWRTNVTTLSGDVNGDGSLAGNSTHVVMNDANGVNNSARLDGFTITGGNANGTSNLDNPEPYEAGGGLFNVNAYPTIANCIFDGNKALQWGGAVYNYTTSGTGTAQFQNCIFRNNTATLGGALYNRQVGVTVINSVFYRNSAAGNGGGMLNNSSNNVIVTITNCAFNANTSGGNGKDVYSTASAGSRLIRNSIFWGNTQPIYDAVALDLVVANSIVQQASGVFTGTGNLNVNPLFVDAANGNLRLSAGSPAINSGNNSFNSTALDLDVNARINGTIDMGPYEFTGPPPCTAIGLSNDVVAATIINGCTVSAIATATFAFSITPVSLNAAQYNSMGFSVTPGSCAIASVSYADVLNTALTTPGNLVVNRVFTLTDVNGATALATQQITVTDRVAPTVIARNLTVQLTAGGNVLVNAAQVNNGSSDACGIQSVSIDKTVFYCTDLGENTVVLTVTDVNGNSASANAIVTVEDRVGPTLFVQNITAQINVGGVAVITAAMIDNGSFDACGIASMTLSKTLFYCNELGDNLVTLTATDINGNVSTATAIVTVEDRVAPVIFVQDITAQITEGGVAIISAAMVDNGTYDACGIASISLSKTRFDCFDLGSNTITFTAVDVNGNVSTANVTVTVEDNVGPTIITQNITAQIDAGGIVEITPAMIDNGSFDACGLVSLTLSKTRFDCFDLGVNTVTITALDVNGNTSMATAFVTVEDNLGPTMFTRNITAQIDAGGVAIITPAMVNDGSFDACGLDSFRLDKTRFDCFDLGANTVTLTGVDVNGNSASATAIVTVEDNVGPTIITQNITAQIDAGGIVEITPAMVDNGSFDACGLASLTLGKTRFDCFDLGANTVTITALDVNGNTSTATAIVTVEDNVGPTIITQNITAQIDAGGIVEITPAMVDNGSFDACGLDSFRLSKTRFDCFDVGTNTVTLTGVDVNGNSASATATVRVEDHVAPTVLTRNITVQLDDNGSITIADRAVDNGSFDACGLVLYTLSKVTFDCSNLGDNSVTLTVKDANNNSASANAIVTVLGAQTYRWVLDNDGDGFYIGVQVFSCVTPGNGYVLLTNQLPGDCNDSNKAVFPGAAEVCDGIDNNCNGLVDDGVIPVIPVFSIDTVICSNGVVPVLPAVSSNGIAGAWLPAIVSNAVSGTYTFKPTDGLCASEAAIRVTVIALPDASISTLSLLSAASTGNQAIVPDAGIGAEYTWTIVNGTITAGLGTPSVVYTAGSTGSVTLSVSVINAGGCGPVVETVVIPIVPAPCPNPVITLPAAVCSGAAGNMASVPNEGAGAVYVWTITNGVITGGAGTSNISFRATVNTGLDTPNNDSVRISVTVTSGSCSRSSGNYSVFISPLPNATITLAASVCAGSTGNTASVPFAGVGATYSWTVSNGNLLSGAGTNAITYRANSVGTVAITAVVRTAGGCTATTRRSTNIVPVPRPVITVAPGVCSGSADNVASVADAGVGATYTWSITNGTINEGGNSNSVRFTAGASGIVSVSVTVVIGTGCSVTSPTRQVTIYAVPNATISSWASVCTNAEGNRASVLNAGAGATYTWNITGGSITAGQGTSSILYSAGSSGNIVLSVAVTAATGCRATGTRMVRIIQKVKTLFTQIAPVCQGTTAPLLPLRANNGIVGTWSPAVINTSVPGTVNYVFTPAVGQCALPATMSITVQPCSIFASRSGNAGAAVPGKHGRAGKLSATLMPNPAQAHFVLQLKGGANTMVDISVVDIAGRRIEQRRVAAGASITLGEMYHRGVYLIEVINGDERIVLKGVKE